MNIDARNFAATLAYMGADVESALLELVAVSPTLDTKVRRALYHNNRCATLRMIGDRRTAKLHFIVTEQSRWACAMHAVDFIGQLIDDASIVTYLQSRFPDYNIDTLVETE